MADPVRAARQELQRVGLRGDVRAIEGAVPEVILRSWRRSIGSRVDSDEPTLRYQDVDTDSILCRAADPVLDRWQDRLLDTGTTLFLSDRAGSIVARRASDTSLRRRLDTVHAAEGFDYSEDSAGTNGLGTAIAEGHGVYIQGSQHYKDVLGGLSCAAVPVATPTGVAIGAVSLGGSVEAASPLMLSLTREIGQQIEERLRASARPQDLALALSFTRFTNSRRPTVVMDGESILANTPGLPFVSVDLHVALWETLSGQDWRSSDTVRLRIDDLSSAVVARRVIDGPRAHFVVHFDAVGAPPEGRGRSEGWREAPAPRSAAQDVVAVLGPPGSGRAEQARAHHAGTGRPAVVEWSMSGPVRTPWDEVEDALRAGSDVLLRRAEGLRGEQATRLLEVVTQHRRQRRQGARTSMLLVTACPERTTTKVRSVLEAGTAHRTQPLATTPDRIPGIVRTVLDRVDEDGRRALSPAALQDLMRWSWPGELTELVETVTDLVREVPGPVIERHHLPAPIRNASPRRQLSRIEEAERSAILRALQECDGNKSVAATMLGIGRTTLYRRIKQLGLESDEGLV